MVSVELNLIGYLQEYSKYAEKGFPHVLLDVRPEVQVGMCSLPNTTSRHNILSAFIV